MAGEIVLIVDKVVVRDDGNVIGAMRATLSAFHGYTEKLELDVLQILEMWQADVAALHVAVQGLATQLDQLLVRPPLPTVDPQAVEALAAQIHHEAQRIGTLVPDTFSHLQGDSHG
jgi:hypothetical protein